MGLTIFSLITCFLLKLQLKQSLLTNILTPIETTDTANILRLNKENNFNFYHASRSSKPIKLFQSQKGVTAMTESFKTFLRDFKDVLFSQWPTSKPAVGSAEFHSAPSRHVCLSREGSSSSGAFRAASV